MTALEASLSVAVTVAVAMSVAAVAAVSVLVTSSLARHPASAADPSRQWRDGRLVLEMIEGVE